MTYTVSTDGAAAPLPFGPRCIRRRLTTMTAAVVLSLSAGTTQGADGASGAGLAEAKGCVACHGREGVATAPIYPNLAGQWEQYLRLQLMAYRSGKRENQIMQGFAQNLTDDEIRALARHYSGG
jgi:cytochrome c553